MTLNSTPLIYTVHDRCCLRTQETYNFIPQVNLNWWQRDYASVCGKCWYNTAVQSVPCARLILAPVRKVYNDIDDDDDNNDNTTYSKTA